MSRRKDGTFPRRKGGNCNKSIRSKRDDDSSPGNNLPRRCTLRGKEIGLFYRNKQILKNEVERKQKEEEVESLKVTLPDLKYREIEQLLLNVREIEGNSADDLMVDGAFKNSFKSQIEGTFEEKMQKLKEEIMPQNTALDEEMKRDLEMKESTTKYNTMLSFRKKLPSYKMRKELVKTIEENQIVLISGETGCGKTTQVVQFILDDYIKRGCGSTCNIMCTQPRRISAISVAERVAAERNETIGETVGYQIRLEKKLPKRKQGFILFVTTGIVLQKIQSNPLLNEISHLFLDEIHERDILSDFVITFLKEIVGKRPTLKVILMSATLNSEQFSAYYGGIPSIEIPGFSFPVEEIYLHQILQLVKFSYSGSSKINSYFDKRDNEFKSKLYYYLRDQRRRGLISYRVQCELENPLSEEINLNLIEQLLRYISTSEDEGAILVFLPGIAEIGNLHKQLLSRHFFNNSKFLIIPLHSKLPTMNQRRIFDHPPKGVRKIVISTNIAETSITIDDVVYVIDCGYMKLEDFNLTINVSTLQSNWISQANAKQRRGRAGRVRAGKCYKLYTVVREESFEQYPLPKIQRTRLEEVVLQVKQLQLGQAALFLMKVMNPPNPQTVKLSLEMLRTLNALDEKEKLTPLGYHLSKLPMDPQLGKMILMAAIFSCVDPVLTIAASIAFKDPFIIPLGKEGELNNVKKALSDDISDHIVLYQAFKGWEEAREIGYEKDYAWEHFLSMNTLYLLRDMKKQFARHLHEMNFIETPKPDDPKANINSYNLELVKAVLCSGLYPNVAIVRSVAGEKAHPRITLRTKDHFRVEPHPKSICGKTMYFKHPFLVYHNMVKSKAIYIHDATVISPWPLLFFGERLDLEGDCIRVDKIVKFKCDMITGVLIKKLRAHLDWILASSVANPEVINWCQSGNKMRVLKAIVQLMTDENIA